MKHDKNQELACERVVGPFGDWVVSTIRTYAGGAHNHRPFGSPFSLKDYHDETPWPFETKVFPAVEDKEVLMHYHGELYFQPHLSEKAARVGHKFVVAMVVAGAVPTQEAWQNNIRSGAMVKISHWFHDDKMKNESMPMLTYEQIKATEAGQKKAKSMFNKLLGK